MCTHTHTSCFYIFSTDVTSECGTVPKNSVTTPNYKTDAWSHDTLFEYNGCEFIHDTFRDEEIYSIYAYNQVTAKEVTLYEYADTSSNVVSIIPKGTEVDVLKIDGVKLVVKPKVVSSTKK